MIVRNLGAVTQPGANLPGFVSVNQVDGGVQISVRARARVGGERTVEGSTASLVLNTDEYQDLLRQLVINGRPDV